MIARKKAQSRHILIPFLLPIDLQSHRGLFKPRIIVVLTVHRLLCFVARQRRRARSHHAAQRPVRCVAMQKRPQVEYRIAGNRLVHLHRQNRGTAPDLHELQRENRGNRLCLRELPQRERVFGEIPRGEAVTQDLSAGEVERETPADAQLDLDGDVGQEVESVGSHLEEGLVVLGAGIHRRGELAGAGGGPGLVGGVDGSEPGGGRLGGGVEGEVPERLWREEQACVEGDARRGETGVEEALGQRQAVEREGERGRQEARVARVLELEHVIPAGHAEGAGEGGAGGGGGDERLGEEDGVGGPEREGEEGLHVLDVL